MSDKSNNSIKEAQKKKIEMEQQKQKSKDEKKAKKKDKVDTLIFQWAFFNIVI